LGTASIAEAVLVSGLHQTVLWFTKGDDYYFDLGAVRVPQKYPGKTYTPKIPVVADGHEGAVGECRAITSDIEIPSFSAWNDMPAKPTRICPSADDPLSCTSKSFIARSPKYQCIYQLLRAASKGHQGLLLGETSPGFRDRRTLNN
jgi:hypothetical protein